MSSTQLSQWCNVGEGLSVRLSVDVRSCSSAEGSSSSVPSHKRNASALSDPAVLPDSKGAAAAPDVKRGPAYSVQTVPDGWECPICMGDRGCLVVIFPVCAKPHELCFECAYRCLVDRQKCPVCNVTATSVSLTIGYDREKNMRFFRWLTAGVVSRDVIAKLFSNYTRKTMDYIILQALSTPRNIELTERMVAFDQYYGRMLSPTSRTGIKAAELLNISPEGSSKICRLSPIYCMNNIAHRLRMSRVETRGETEIVWFDSYDGEVCAMHSPVFAQCLTAADCVLSTICTGVRACAVAVRTMNIDTVCGQRISAVQYYVTERLAQGWTGEEVARVIGALSYAVAMASLDDAYLDQSRSLGNRYAVVIEYCIGKTDATASLCEWADVVDRTHARKLFSAAVDAPDRTLSLDAIAATLGEWYVRRVVPALCDSDRFGRQARRTADGRVQLCVEPDQLDSDIGLRAPPQTISPGTGISLAEDSTKDGSCGEPGPNPKRFEGPGIADFIWGRQRAAGERQAVDQLYVSV
jgi:hypothetical protein